MGLTGCEKFGKVFLIVINIIFFLLGLGLFIVGILMKVNVSAISDDVKPALNAVTVTSFKLGDLVDNLSILFILDCCAVNNTKTDFDSTPWHTTGKRATAKIPRTCCKGTDSDSYVLFTSSSPCVRGTIGYNTKGCYDALQDQISTYGNVFIGVGITILLIELLAVVFACMICCQTGKDDVV
ncbi:tetraspanin-36-like [Saccostrea echinata]|uniref:tetraspanin-36-like n=1 Tax=Saccostrea echinata TaxID=191078 RepID=UPI002A83EF03|nr:tetraspanin-36-like [Saccostrea echinata]